MQSQRHQPAPPHRHAHALPAAASASAPSSSAWPETVDPAAAAPSAANDATQWTGNGMSHHTDTLDVTRWLDVRLQLQLHWSGECTLTGSGASVLRRWTLGASQALRALAIEEQQRRQAEAARRFPGDGYRVGDGKKVKQTPQNEAPRALADRDAPPQNYPGVDCAQNVVVPFLLLGSFNLKTGEAHLEKAHIRYVYNNITYRGRVRAIGVNADGQYVELPCSALAHQLEAASIGLQPAPQHRVHKLRFDMAAPWSQAALLISADVDIVHPPQPQSQPQPQPQPQQQQQQQPSSPVVQGAAAGGEFPDAPNRPFQVPEQSQHAPPGGPAHTSPSVSAADKHARSSSEQSHLGSGFDLLCAAAAQAQMDESS